MNKNDKNKINVVDTLSVDEWQHIASFVPINEGILNLMTCCSFMYHQIMNLDSFWYQMLQIYYSDHPALLLEKEKERHCSHQVDLQKWKREFKTYHLLLGWDPEQCHSLIQLSDHNRTLNNPTDYYFLPVRMKMPIMRSDKYMLCVEVTNSNDTKVYGSSIGIVTHPLLYEHLENGFRNPVFNYLSKEDQDQTTFSHRNTSLSALYLGHYYIPSSSVVSFSVKNGPDPNVPPRYYNCGFFDNGYMVSANGSYGHESSWEKGDVIKMHVSLTYNGTGFVQYFVNGKPVNRPFYNIYQPSDESGGDYPVYAAMTVGRQWKLRTRAKYIPLVPPDQNLKSELASNLAALMETLVDN